MPPKALESSKCRLLGLHYAPVRQNPRGPPTLQQRLTQRSGSSSRNTKAKAPSCLPTKLMPERTVSVDKDYKLARKRSGMLIMP